MNASASCDKCAITPTLTAHVRQPVAFDVQGYRLHGMLDLPEPAKRRKDVGIVLLNSDDGCRLGPNNLWLRLADALTEQGHACLRFDYRGCGDSEGPEESPTGVAGLTDAIAAEQFLREQTGAQATILIGICYGAEIALLAHRSLRTVRGVVACSAGHYVAADGYGHALAQTARHVQGYVRKACQLNTWDRLIRGHIQLLAIWDDMAGRVSRSCWRRDREGAAAAHSLAGPDRPFGPQLFIYGSADPLTRRSMPRYRREAEQMSLSRRFHVIDQADHNFSSVDWSAQLIETVVAFVEDVSGTGR